MLLLQQHLSAIDPLYWVLSVLCSFIYAMWNGSKNYKIDKANPNTITNVGQWKAIGTYYLTPPVVIANLLTFLMSVAMVIIITLNQSEYLKDVKDGEFTGQSAALIACATVLGSAWMLSYLTAKAKIKEMQNNPSNDNPPS